MVVCLLGVKGAPTPNKQTTITLFSNFLVLIFVMAEIKYDIPTFKVPVHLCTSLIFFLSQDNHIGRNVLVTTKAES